MTGADMNNASGNLAMCASKPAISAMSSEGCESDCTLSVLLQATQQLSQHLTRISLPACQVLGQLLCGL